MADVQENMGRDARRPIDDFLGTDGPGGVYGLAFDKAAGYLKGVLRRMSEEVGWKDPSRTMDFGGFSGYYPDFPKDVKRADVCRGDEIVASFFPRPDGRLGLETYGAEFSRYPDDVNPWYPLADIMDGWLCLDQSNLDRAAAEMHHGNEVVYGIRVGEDCAFACRSDDERLRAALAEAEPNIRFVTPEAYDSAMRRWLEKDAVPGFEGTVRPQVVRYAWDGDRLRSEKEYALDQPRQVRKDWGDDWEFIGRLREEGEKIRGELEEAAGVKGPDGRRFRFSDAIYPSLFVRDDALFVTTKCGAVASDYITVAQGRVGYYRGYDPDSPLPKPEKVFGSCKEAVDRLREVVLGERNVQKAAMDYQKYLQARAESRRQDGPEVKPSGVRR